MSKNPYHNVAPSTLEATGAAIVAFDAFLSKYRAGKAFAEDGGDDRESRLMFTRARSFNRKRARMMDYQDGLCSQCSRAITNELGFTKQDSVAVIDYLIPLSWGGPKHELNMTLVCFDCGMKGAVRQGMDVEEAVSGAKAGLIPYLNEQSRLNKV